MKLILTFVFGLLSFQAFGGAEVPEIPVEVQERFLRGLTALFQRHYPKATIKSTYPEIRVDYRTRFYTFPKHTHMRSAGQHLGPEADGIMCQIVFVSHPYSRSLVRPQTVGITYWECLCLAPYSEKYDAHIFINLDFGRKVSEKFKKEFQFFIDGFEDFRVHWP